MSLENGEKGSDLLANIRRLTLLVLNDLEEGIRNRTLDPVEKRLLSSTGARLLRLWKLVEREGSSKRVMEEVQRTVSLSSGHQKDERGSET